MYACSEEIAHYILTNPFPGRLELLKKIGEILIRNQDPLTQKYGLYLSVTLRGLTLPGIPDGSKEFIRDYEPFNYEAIKAIYESNLDPETTKQAAFTIARSGMSRPGPKNPEENQLDEMKGMYHVLVVFCFPDLSPNLRICFAARLSALWDGIHGWLN